MAPCNLARLPATRSLFILISGGSLPNKVEVLAAGGEQAKVLNPRNRLKRYLVPPAMNFRVTINVGKDPTPGMTTAGQVVPCILPRLWIDPLGPMVKIFPIMVLTLVALAILKDR